MLFGRLEIIELINRKSQNCSAWRSILQGLTHSGYGWISGSGCAHMCMCLPLCMCMGVCRLNLLGFEAELFWTSIFDVHGTCWGNIPTVLRRAICKVIAQELRITTRRLRNPIPNGVQCWVLAPAVWLTLLWHCNSHGSGRAQITRKGLPSWCWSCQKQEDVEVWISGDWSGVILLFWQLSWPHHNAGFLIKLL